MSQIPVVRYDDLILSRNIVISGERAAYYARVRAGDLVRVARGAAVSCHLWQSLTPAEQHRALLLATQVTARSELVFSHSSAAALWRLPWIGAWPTRAHIVTDTASGGRSRPSMVVHATGMPRETVLIEGLRCTTAAQTAVDLASSLPFSPGVAFADAVLRRATHPVPGVAATHVTHADLSLLASELPHARGSSRARRAIDFANGEADRPGESLSRVTMHLAGITAPQLQVALFGASGRRYVVDFWWPEYSAFGEFDGAAKYKDPEFLGKRTPEQALLDEKRREDDLRAMDRSCARWDWVVAQSVPMLRERLARAGVR